MQRRTGGASAVAGGVQRAATGVVRTLAVAAVLALLAAGCSEDPAPEPAPVTTDAADDADDAVTDDEPATDDTPDIGADGDLDADPDDDAPDGVDGSATGDAATDPEADGTGDADADDPDGGAGTVDPDAAEGHEVTVQVFFTTDERGSDLEVHGFDRTVRGPAVLDAALRELLAGPSAEEEAEGAVSWFSEETAQVLRSVRIEDGTAHVDLAGELRELLPGASSSTGSRMLLLELDATTTQFDTVERAIYALDGDVEAFYTWLQRTPPRT